MTDDIDQIPLPRQLGARRRGALRDVLMEEVRGSSRPWWRRTWKGAAVGGSAFAMVLAGGAATAYVAFKAPSNTASVLCYSAPQLKSEHIDGTRIAVARSMPAGSSADDSGTVAIADPVAACSQAWQDGLLTAGKAPSAPSVGARHQVPTLVACTLEEGVAAVFPGNPSTCERLGLPQVAG
ncbi:hypothetical protein [Actinopolymorpha pittospori]|uniref:Uncharacterized protein n=1 Tax=Actinopolymorpha pittospori TaxID=648752 RepID=A0A927MUS2_9ACTN|nr:hypothetical protein [Actinopolymorpha pittospori]MBE1605203.1 hypothetical protein [Actinopolymorpha pittospori]